MDKSYARQSVMLVFCTAAASAAPTAMAAENSLSGSSPSSASTSPPFSTSPSSSTLPPAGTPPPAGSRWLVGGPLPPSSPPPTGGSPPNGGSPPAGGAAPADGWTFEVTPYFWAAGISGWSRVGSRTPTVRFDADFSEVWDHLDFGAMGSFEARKGRWGILFDAFYVKINQRSKPLAEGLLGTVNTTLKQTILQAAGAYRVYDDPKTPIDVLAGVRYNNIDGDLDFSSSRVLPNGPNLSRSVDWTDGFVGVRGTYALTDKWSLLGYADAGTGGGDYSWQLIGGVNYEFSKTLVGKFGYRIISMKYDSNNFLYNAKTRGLYLGLGIRF